jgi:hypothetical protein
VGGGERGEGSALSTRARHTFENPLNGCARCGRDFSSLAAFDAHFVNLAADHRWTPERPDGFRCLDEDEIAEKLEVDDRGRYRLPLTEEKRKQLLALRQNRA